MSGHDWYDYMEGGKVCRRCFAEEDDPEALQPCRPEPVPPTPEPRALERALGVPKGVSAVSWARLLAEGARLAQQRFPDDDLAGWADRVCDMVAKREE